MPSWTHVGHVQVGFLSVPEVGNILGISPKTVTRWCKTGKLAAVPKQYGRKKTWQISPQAVELLKASQAKPIVSPKPFQTKEVPWEKTIQCWKTAMQRGALGGKPFSPRTIETYLIYAKSFMQTYQHVTVKALQIELMNIDPKHFAKRLKLYESVVCLTRFLTESGQLEETIMADLKKLRPQRHLPPKRLTVDETGINNLLKSCDNLQDRLMISLLVSTGLRASEFCALKFEDIHLEKQTLTVKLGKGNKTRRLGLTDSVIALLIEFFRQSPDNAGAYVFKNALGKPMDRYGLGHRLQRIGKKAGVIVSPHALRRAFVTLNANKGRPLQMLQRACGHSDIRTTMAYCQTSEEEVISAMQEWE